jgi:hypothetical protein
MEFENDNLQIKNSICQPPTANGQRSTVNGQRSTVNGQRSTKKPLGVAENPFPELPFFTK